MSPAERCIYHEVQRFLIVAKHADRITGEFEILKAARELAECVAECDGWTARPVAVDPREEQP